MSDILITIEDMYDEGFTASEIAAAIGFPEDQVLAGIEMINESRR